MSERQHLVHLLATRSFRRGDFKLSSGAQSSYYIDARLTTMSGEGQRLIGALGLERLRDMGWEPHVVGGLTLGADPVAYALAHRAAERGLPLDAFTVRKEAKAHGTGQRIEGVFAPGMRAVVVEDVITTGESALRAVSTVEEAGGLVLGVLAVVDREAGGRERILRAGYDVAILVSLADLLQSEVPS